MGTTYILLSTTHILLASASEDYKEVDLLVSYWSCILAQKIVSVPFCGKRGGVTLMMASKFPEKQLTAGGIMGSRIDFESL